MAENCKIISVTANNPVVTIPNGAKVATAETKEIITNVPVTPLVTNVSDNCVKSNLSGLGEEWIPDSRLFKFNVEDLNLNDYLVQHAGKVIIDDPNMSEVISKHAAKVLSDTYQALDTFDRVWNVIRFHTDSTTNSELTKYSVGKNLRETKTFQELLRFNTRTVYADSISMSDLTKMLILVKSGKFEQVNFSDVFSRIVNYVRIFNDQVDATDDFYGVMNVDDDQYALVQKVVLEFKEIRERFSVRLNRAPILDVVDPVETIAKRLERPFFDISSALASEPYFYSNLGKRETVTYSELFKYSIAKITDDEIVLSSDIVANHLEKILEDSITITDDAFITRFKGAEDTSLMQDLISFGLNSTLLDSFTFSEELATSTSKVLEGDTANLSEPLFTKIVSICVNEIDYFAEAYVLEDYTFKAVHATDAITDVRFSKIIHDIVDATDDFYGTANIDDDQYATVTKVIADNSSISDVFSRIVSFIRSYSDLFSLSELQYFIFGKQLSDTAMSFEETAKDASTIKSDSITNTDLMTNSVNKRALDSVSYTEFKLFAVYRVVSDTVLKSDVVAKAISTLYESAATAGDTFNRIFVAFRSFADTVVKSDLATILVGKNVVDVIGTSELNTYLVSKAINDTTLTLDTKVFNVSKKLLDIVDATDDFYGEANTDDDQYANVTKTLADYASPSELFSRIVTFIRSYTDTVLKTDIATLNFNKRINDTSITSEYVTKAGAKVLSETSSTSQTVQLGIQDYFASNYVVPGYVGQTFTY